MRGASDSLLVSVLLLLLLRGRGCAFFLLVHDEARVALFGVPLEAGEDGQVELVVSLGVGQSDRTKELGWCWRLETYLLLELLVDGVQRILDGHALEVSRSDLEAQREVQVDLADQRKAERLLEDILVFESSRGGVQLPVREVGQPCKSRMGSSREEPETASMAVGRAGEWEGMSRHNRS